MKARYGVYLTIKTVENARLKQATIEKQYNFSGLVESLLKKYIEEKQDA